MNAINQNIVAFEVVKSIEDSDTPQLPEDPMSVKIDKRPEGELDAKINKVVYYTQEGRRSIYLAISYLPVEVVYKGQKLVCERPVEFFIPVGQKPEDTQYISALMRTLSFAARETGNMGKALQDWQGVVWDKGPVRYGLNEFDKPNYYDSEVAALATAFIDMLHNRGLVDKAGNLLPLEERLARCHAVCQAQPSLEVVPAPVVKESSDSDIQEIGRAHV